VPTRALSDADSRLPRWALDLDLDLTQVCRPLLVADRLGDEGGETGVAAQAGIVGDDLTGIHLRIRDDLLVA
jgi:hypothetical protein